MGIGAIGSASVDYFSPAAQRVGQARPGQVDSSPAKSDSANSTQDSPETRREVQRLKQIDQKVRAHEQAHLSAAAGLATGGASYQTVRGPDGRQYAVGGEVQISVSAAATPEQTIVKAQRIRAAALAPSDPSSQDRAVAAGASQLEQQARIELSRQKHEESNSTNPVAQLVDAAKQPSERQGRKAIEAYRQSDPVPESTFSSVA